MTIKDRAEAAMNALLRAAKDEPKLLECSAEVLESLVFTLMGVRVPWEEMVRANDLVGETSNIHASVKFTIDGGDVGSFDEHLRVQYAAKQSVAAQLEREVVLKSPYHREVLEAIATEIDCLGEAYIDGTIKHAYDKSAEMVRNYILKKETPNGD
jgi:hypothetical protein